MRKVATSSNQPDLKIVEGLLTAQFVCLAVTGLIGAVVLCGWLIPVIGTVLPGGWSMMKANTALALLLCTLSLFLTLPKRSEHRLLGGAACASIAVVLASGALVEHLGGHILGIDTLMAADSGARTPGRMSVQTASFLVLLGLVLIFEHLHQVSLPAYVPDTLTIALILVTLIVLAGYIFGAPHLFGQSQATRTSPQTLTCMGLLTFAAVVRRTRDGFFSALVGVGIGSRSLRGGLPVALLMPFLLIGLGVYSMVRGWLSAPYAAALTTTLISILFFVVNVERAKIINDLERDLRDLSLTDALTTLYNRRGFYLLGEQALSVTRRIEIPLTVLFFDVDGLKTINDTLGHDVGSQLLADVADLLRANFRNSDVVARIGGDEFAVVVSGLQPELMPMLIRLDDATTAGNSTGNKKPYHVSYSVGEATTESGHLESFSELVDRADAAMYQRKRLKKSLHRSFV